MSQRVNHRLSRFVSVVCFFFLTVSVRTSTIKTPTILSQGQEGGRRGEGGREGGAGGGRGSGRPLSFTSPPKSQGNEGGGDKRKACQSPVAGAPPPSLGRSTMKGADERRERAE